MNVIKKHELRLDKKVQVCSVLSFSLCLLHSVFFFSATLIHTYVHRFEMRRATLWVESPFETANECVHVLIKRQRWSRPRLLPNVPKAPLLRTSGAPFPICLPWMKDDEIRGNLRRYLKEISRCINAFHEGIPG